jgi:hypothetical protein
VHEVPARCPTTTSPPSRDLATPLAALVAGDVPVTPVVLGL